MDSKKQRAPNNTRSVARPSEKAHLRGRSAPSRAEVYPLRYIAAREGAEDEAGGLRSRPQQDRVLLGAHRWSAAPLRSATHAHPLLRAVSETLLIFAVLLFLLGLLGVRPAQGAEIGGLSPFPASQIFPRPVGIVFPGLNTAAGINPAALVNGGNRLTALQAAWSPAMKSGDPNEYFASLGYSNSKVGFGFGYDGTQPAKGSLQNGIFTGIGFGLDQLSLGIDMRQADLAGAFSPALDLGLRWGGRGGVNFAAVMYDLGSGSQLDAGLGFAGHGFTLEGNVLLPPFNAWSNGYTLTAAATVSAGVVGLYLRSSYFTAPSTFSHSLGLSLALAKSTTLVAQYTTDRTLTAAVTLLL